MIIWIIALIVLAATVVLGYTQGAIKTAVSTVGLVLGAVLCVPLGHFMQPAVAKLGFANPLVPIFVAPVVVLIVVRLIFQVIANTAHHSVDTYFKYRTAEFHYTLWQRTNDRFGIAFAVLNATIYTILIALLISIMGYPAVQLSAGDEDRAALRYLVKAAESVKTTKMNKVVAAFDPAPARFYAASDLVGLVYRNPMAWGRLTSYPPLLVFCQNEEFAAIGNDSEVSQLLLRQPPLPIGKLLAEPKIAAVVNNKPLVKQIFGEFMKIDFNDLSNYLHTGKSGKFDEEKILGRWEFGLAATMRAWQKANPKANVKQINQELAKYKAEASKSTMNGLVDKVLLLRIASKDENNPDAPIQITPVKGTWENIGPGKYEITGIGDNQQVSTDGDRIQLKHEGRIYVFEKEH